MQYCEPSAKVANQMILKISNRWYLVIIHVICISYSSFEGDEICKESDDISLIFTVMRRGIFGNVQRGQVNSQLEFVQQNLSAQFV
jgi:hypothetical protein